MLEASHYDFYGIRVDFYSDVIIDREKKIGTIVILVWLISTLHPFPRVIEKLHVYLCWE